MFVFKELTFCRQQIHQFREGFRDLFLLSTPHPTSRGAIEVQLRSSGRLDQEIPPRERQLDTSARWDHVKCAKHLPQLLVAFATAMTSVAHNHGRLALPLMIKVVNGVLEDGRVSPVVLRRDKDERVVTLNLLAPGTGVSMIIFGVVGDLGWDIRFVEKGKIPLLKVDDVQGRLDRAGTVQGRRFDGVNDEVRDLRVSPRLSSAANDNANPWCAACHLRMAGSPTSWGVCKMFGVGMRHGVNVSARCSCSAVVEVDKID